MGFVDKHQKILGKEMKQGKRSFTGLSEGQVPGIVFNTVTETLSPQHLNIIARPLFQALGFQKPVRER
jgi:hypothetical protein